MSEEIREAIRCPHCRLNQFAQENCRRCRQPLRPAVPAPLPVEDAVGANSVPVEAGRHRAGGDLLFGEVIRSLRKTRDLSQRQLAARCDFQRSYVSKVEHDVCTPTLASLVRIAASLGVPVWSLVQEAEQRHWAKQFPGRAA